VTVGPILLGVDKPAHILTQTATVRGILNMTALAVVDAAQLSTRTMSKIAAE
jgi:malate dehydrogenase (oxaloacetate-decarboxylating)(NADP+)